jgi:hypothetical protein
MDQILRDVVHHSHRPGLMGLNARQDPLCEDFFSASHIIEE